MKTIIPLLILLLLSPITGTVTRAQPLLQRLSTAHGPFWSEAFGTADWRGSDIGFVVVKHTAMLYVVRQDARHDTIAVFPICAMETSPGFKERQGDGRTPDGIYRIPLLNPASSYHLSLKLDYPNAVDDARHRRHTRLAGQTWPQGGDIFIHGKCVSIGCIAMTDDAIEKLYLLVASLPAGRRRIPVLVLPYDDESQYEQMYVHADRQYRTDGDPFWLLLRDHLDNMRDLWRYYRDSGRIPKAVPTAAGLYALPRNHE